MFAQVLATQRLVLRPPRAADDRAALALLNDPAIARMTARVPHPVSLADIAGRRRLGKIGGERMFAVERDGDLIRAAGVKLPGSGEPPRIMPRLGYWIGALYQGSGYGTEAVRALVRACFMSADCDVVGGGVFADNPASVRILEKCGFEPVGRYMTFGTARKCHVDTIDFNLTAARYRTVVHD
jgi:RimJ/RimL family protein N-acetyltransferase